MKLNKYTDRVIEIMREIMQEQNKDDDNVFAKHPDYHEIWTNMLVKEFAHLFSILFEKLSYDGDNIKYLGDVSSKIFEINQTVFYLVEEGAVNYIWNSAIAYAKSLTAKFSASLKNKPNLDKADEHIDEKKRPNPVAKYDEILESVKECMKMLIDYGDLHKIDIKQEIIAEIIRHFNNSLVHVMHNSLKPSQATGASDNTENTAQKGDIKGIETIDFIPEADLLYLKDVIDHIILKASEFDFDYQGFDITIFKKQNEKLISNLEMLSIYLF